MENENLMSTQIEMSNQTSREKVAKHQQIPLRKQVKYFCQVNLEDN
jgi:hypothetical protein